MQTETAYWLDLPVRTNLGTRLARPDGADLTSHPFHAVGMPWARWIESNVTIEPQAQGPTAGIASKKRDGRSWKDR